MKLTCKITFSVQTCFLVGGHLRFEVNFISGKYGDFFNNVLSNGDRFPVLRKDIAIRI
jgi:hypothetical protein